MRKISTIILLAFSIGVGQEDTDEKKAAMMIERGMSRNACSNENGEHSPKSSNPIS